MAKATQQEQGFTKTSIADYLRCSYPALAVETFEEERLIEYLRQLARSEEFSKLKMFSVSATQKLVDLTTGKVIDAQMSFPKAFAFAAEKEERLLIVHDVHHILQNSGIYRYLKEQIPALKASGSHVVMVAPQWKLPAELLHDVKVVDFALPTREELNAALEVVLESSRAKKPDAALRAALLDAASGLTLQEAEDALALSISKRKALVPEVVAYEKVVVVESTGLLEIAPPPDVRPAGLGEWKRYIQEEILPVKDDPMLRPKGALFVGIPGTGKTLSGLDLAAALGWPALTADIGSLKGSLQGQSEGNMSMLLKTVEAASPCILILDEIEKGVGGYQSSAQTDGGTTLGMVGKLLKWMQLQTKVFVFGTCNDYSLLPAPLTRPGRFDALFFVDLPTSAEREEIATAQLRKYIDDPDGFAKRIVELTEGWTGAEIGELVKSAARRTRRVMTAQAITDAAKDIRPISLTRSEEIKTMREWAKDRFRLANTIEETVAIGGRKIR